MALGAGVIVAPFGSLAQQSRNPVRVGILVAGVPDPAPFLKSFRERFRELGYVEGQNALLEIRSAEGMPDRLPALAAGLVAQKVDVIVSAYPHAIFPGTITYISDVLDPATRTMRLRVTVPNPDHMLKPEMFATVRVYAAPDPDALTIPLAAVQNGPNGKMAFVRRGEREFEVRTVKLGLERGDLVTVLDGVAEGDTVALIKDLKLGGSQVLKAGTKAKSIRLVDGDHEIACRIEGTALALKACFVKKA